MQCEHFCTLKTTFSSLGVALTKFSIVLQLEHCTMCEVIVFALQLGQINPKSPGVSSGFTKKILLHFELLHFAKCQFVVDVVSIFDPSINLWTNLTSRLEKVH